MQPYSPPLWKRYMSAIGKLRPALRQLKCERPLWLHQRKEQGNENRRVLGVALAGLSVIGVTAYGQVNMPSHCGGATAAVVDDKGNLRVPSDYRAAYQVLDGWAMVKDGGAGSVVIARNCRRVTTAPFS
jgi:hypothetical protein